jgi:hypothetical protein
MMESTRPEDLSFDTARVTLRQICILMEAMFEQKQPLYRIEEVIQNRVRALLEDPAILMVIPMTVFNAIPVPALHPNRNNPNRLLEEEVWCGYHNRYMDLLRRIDRVLESFDPKNRDTSAKWSPQLHHL